MKKVRILISSPNDVREERDRARGVVQQLRRRFVGRLDLQAILWEDLPLQADMSFQEGIDVVLSDAGVDIAVFILWARLGSPTGPLMIGKKATSFRSGTEREWHLMLESRQNSKASGGEPRPSLLVYTRSDECSFEERLRGLLDEEKVELIAQKKLVKQFIKEEFADAETGVNIRAYHSFDHPTRFTEQLRVHLTGLLDGIAESTDSTPQWRIAEDGMPFRGLQVFEFEHAPIFFGREDEIVSIRMRLREHASLGCAFVLISGASGTGKSSLARAGVVPEIVTYEVDPTVGQWRRLVVKPSELGHSLLEALVHKLMEPSALPELAAWHDDLTFSHEATDFSSWLARFQLRVLDALKLASKPGKNCRLIIVVDQLEELFSSDALTANDRDQFCEALEILGKSGCVWIIATIRTDHYQHCQSVPSLMRMIEGKSIFDLLPPTPDALLRVITGPATLSGLQFEVVDNSSLADAILREAIEHKELLPLLEHVLLDLCEHRSPDGKLIFNEFQRVGGVQGALNQRCEQVFSQLPPGSQSKLGYVLADLITLSGDQEIFVRRTAPLAVFKTDPQTLELVLQFTEARLFTIAANSKGESVISVAHEALIRVWPRAQQWIFENREYLRLRTTLQQSHNRWSQLNRDRSLLLPTGLPLEEGRRFLRLDQSVSNHDLTSYIHQSIQADSSRRRRWNLSIGGGVLLLLLISAVTVWSLSTSRAAALASVDKLTLAQKATQDQLVVAKAERLALQSSEVISQSTSLALLLSVQAAESLLDQDLPIQSSVQQALINTLHTTNYSSVNLPRDWTLHSFLNDGLTVIVRSESDSNTYGMFDLDSPTRGVIVLGVASTVHIGDMYFILRGERELRFFSRHDLTGVRIPYPDASPIHLTKKDLLVTAHSNQLKVWDLSALVNNAKNGKATMPLAAGPLPGIASHIAANETAATLCGRFRIVENEWEFRLFKVDGEKIVSLPMEDAIDAKTMHLSREAFTFSRDGKLLKLDSNQTNLYSIGNTSVNQIEVPLRHSTRLLQDGKVVYTDLDESAVLYDCSSPPEANLIRKYDSTVVHAPNQSANCFLLGLGNNVYRLWQLDENHGPIQPLDIRMPTSVNPYDGINDDTDTFFHLSWDKSILSTVANNTVHQWDLGNPHTNLQRRVLSYEDHPLLVQPIGQMCLVGQRDSISLWDPDVGEMEFATGQGEFQKILLSRDGSRLIALDRDSTIRRWTIADFIVELPPFQCSSAVIGLSPDGASIYTLDRNSEFSAFSVTEPGEAFLNFSLGELQFELDGSEQLETLFSTSGRFLALSDEDTLALLDLKLRKVVYGNSDAYKPKGAFFDSERRFVIDGEIIDTNTGESRELPTALHGDHWAFADDRRILTTNLGGMLAYNSSAMIWTSQTKDDEKLPMVPMDFLDVVAMSNNGLWMAGSQVDSVRLWKLTEQGAEAYALTLPLSDVFAIDRELSVEELEFSADDRRLYAVIGTHVVSWNLDFRELCGIAHEFMKRELTVAEKTLYLENSSVTDTPPPQTPGGMF